MGFPQAPSISSIPQAGSPKDPSDQAVRNARLQERRKQLGLQGRQSTFLTDYRGSLAPAASTQSTLLGQ